jgi:hypothetical protein
MEILGWAHNFAPAPIPVASARQTLNELPSCLRIGIILVLHRVIKSRMSQMCTAPFINRTSEDAYAASTLYQT